MGDLTPSVTYLVNMEKYKQRFQFRFNPKVDAGPDEMIDHLLKKMEVESIASKLRQHLNLDKDGYDDFLEEFAEKAKKAPKVIHVNDYSGV